MTEILGDSGEYEFLTEAVELSKNIDGMLVEIGLRLGMGTKTIIDACLQHRPGSTVISIDPFGSIMYEHREDRFCRLDYTDDMGKRCWLNMSEYVLGKNVNWMPFKMTDTEYFRAFDIGIELYNLETTRCNKYTMVHLDGPHGGEAIAKEVLFFNDRMDSGATIVVDDVSEDFIDIKPVNYLFERLGWDLYKQGHKKNIYIKK